MIFQLSEEVKKELENNAELYTMGDDGTLSQISVNQSNESGVNQSEESSVNQLDESGVISRQQKDSSSLEETIEILYLDPEQNSLTNAQGEEIVLQEKNGEMTFIPETKLDQSLNQIVLKPVKNSVDINSW